jgi:hypothetical protein
MLSVVVCLGCDVLMYVRTYVCIMYVMYACICMYVCVCICMYVCMYVTRKTFLSNSTSRSPGF